MKRNQSHYAQGDVRWYEPRAFDNQSFPPSERISVGIKTPTEREKRAMFVSTQNGTDLERSLAWQERAIRGHVTEVRGYENRGKPIRTPEELLEFGELELVGEVAAEILGEASMAEEEKKASSALSGSSEAKIPASNGTAAPVALPVSTSNVAAA